MSTIEKMTTESGVQVAINVAYAIDTGYNLIYKHMTVTRITLDNTGIAITGFLWANGGNAHLADLPPRLSPNPNMLLQTSLEYTVKPPNPLPH